MATNGKHNGNSEIGEIGDKRQRLPCPMYCIFGLTLGFITEPTAYHESRTTETYSTVHCVYVQYVKRVCMYWYCVRVWSVTHQV